MPPLVFSEDKIQQSQALANSRSLPHSIVKRAQIVLACDAGETNTSIAKRMGLTDMTVGKWRKRYRELGLEGLTVDKVRDIAGRLYLNPPDKAMVLCVDDKCQPPVKKPPECDQNRHEKVLTRIER